MLVLLGVLFGFVVAVAVMVAGIITMIVGVGMIARAIGAIVDFFHGDDEEVEVEVVEGENASDDVIDAEEENEESEDEDEESEDEEVDAEEEVTEE